jgi:hypothetical protein
LPIADDGGLDGRDRVDGEEWRLEKEPFVAICRGAHGGIARPAQVMGALRVPVLYDLLALRRNRTVEIAGHVLEKTRMSNPITVFGKGARTVLRRHHEAGTVMLEKLTS